MFRLWLGLKAAALARFCRLWLFKTSGQAAPSRPGPASALAQAGAFSNFSFSRQGASIDPNQF
jgi:hypothetical protein